MSDENAKLKADRYIGRDGGPPQPVAGQEYTPDEAAALEAVGIASTMSRNDPDYLADLEEQARDVSSVANEVSRVTLVEGQRGAHIEVDLNRKTHRPAGRMAASTMGRLFEAEVHVRRDGGPRAGHDHAEISHGQPPRHVHYKDDRR